MTRVTWITAFIDLPADVHAAGARFWSAVTGYAVSPPRGTEGEFTTLVPPVGDPFLRLQRTRARAGVHLDLHVASPDHFARRAEALGATVVERPGSHVVLSSPGGFVFCLVYEGLSVRPWPTRWTYGHMSLVDQVCLDIPSEGFDAECAFWSALTGWRLRGSARRPEFANLVRPDAIPLRLLLQRLDTPRSGVVSAHLDLATDEREAEVMRHERLGATRAPTPTSPHWTVLRDPTGAAYCVTDRNPETGLLD